MLGLAAALLLVAVALMLPEQRQVRAYSDLNPIAERDGSSNAADSAVFTVHPAKRLVIKEGQHASFVVAVNPALGFDITVPVAVGTNYHVVPNTGARWITIKAGTNWTLFTVPTMDTPAKNGVEYATMDGDAHVTPHNGPDRCGDAHVVLGSQYISRTPGGPHNFLMSAGNPFVAKVQVDDISHETPNCTIYPGMTLFDISPTISVSAGADITEGGNAQFTLSADIAPEENLTVNLTVAESSGSDFVAAGDEGSRSITIPAGETTAKVSVPTTADSEDEPNGAVEVSVAASDDYRVSPSDDSASVKALDDDATTVTLSVASAAGIPETGGTREITVTLGRPLVASETLGVRLSFAGTATLVDDYTLAGAQTPGVVHSSNGNNWTITFNGGSSQPDTATVTLSATSDTIAEDDESIRVWVRALTPNPELTSGGGATHSNEVVTFDILDDDRPPSVGNVTVGSVTRTSATATVNIADAGTAQKTVYLRYRESGGSWSAAQSDTTSGSSSAFSLTGLNAGTAYEVEASLASDFSGSVTATFTTLAPPPGVGSITIGSVTRTSATATVNIDNAGTAQKTVYLRHRASGGLWNAAQSGTTSGASMAFSLTGLSAGTTYNVQASLASDFSGSQTATFTTLSPPQPPPSPAPTATPSPTPTVTPSPSASSVSINGITQTSATATVNIDNAGTAQKTVYLRYRASGGSWGAAQSGTTSGSSRAFSLTGLTAGTTYNVQASLSSGFSGSRTASFTTLSQSGVQPPTPNSGTPPQPSLAGLQVSDITQISAVANAQIENPGTGENTAYLRHRELGTTQWSAIDSETSEGETISFYINSLDPGATCEVQVSFDSDFETYEYATFTTLEAAPSVSGVSISGITQTSATATVSIADAGTAQKSVYLLLRRFGETEWSEARPKTTRGSDVTYDLTSLEPGTTYGVRAYLGTDPGTSKHAVFTTLPLPTPVPPATPDPSVSGVSFGTITQTTADATVAIANAGTARKTVHLHYRVDGTTAWSTVQSSNTNGSSTTISLAGLTAGTTYEVQAWLKRTTSPAGTTIYTFDTLQNPPSISDLRFEDIEQTSATAVVAIAAAGTSQKTVYHKYRVLGTDDWTTILFPAITHGDSAAIALSGLQEETTYEVAVALSQDFSGMVVKSFTTLPPPSLSGVSIGSVTQTSAVATVSIANAGSGQKTVLLQYRQFGESIWNVAKSKTIDGASVTYDLQALEPRTTYEVKAYLGAVPNTPKYTVFTTLLPDTSLSGISVSGISVGSITQTTAVATVSIAYPGTAQKTVHLRYRKVGESEWSDAKSKTTDGASVSFDLADLSPKTKYEVEASLKSDFSGSKSATFTTLAPEPVVSGISVDNITQTTAAAIATIANGDGTPPPDRPGTLSDDLAAGRLE